MLTNYKSSLKKIWCFYSTDQQPEILPARENNRENNPVQRVPLPDEQNIAGDIAPIERPERAIEEPVPADLADPPLEIAEAQVEEGKQ